SNRFCGLETPPRGENSAETNHRPNRERCWFRSCYWWVVLGKRCCSHNILSTQKQPIQIPKCNLHGNIQRPAGTELRKVKGRRVGIKLFETDDLKELFESLRDYPLQRSDIEICRSTTLRRTWRNGLAVRKRKPVKGIDGNSSGDVEGSR